MKIGAPRPRSLVELRSTPEINVFDFDDTLVTTDSYIYVTTGDGRSLKMTPGEYATYSPGKGDSFDFSDFDHVKAPTPIDHMLMKLRYAIKNLGIDNVFILTARGAAAPVKRFLEAEGIPGIRVVALGTSDPNAKANVIRDEVVSRGVKVVKFYDDSPKNVAAVKHLRREFPGVRILSFKA